MVKLTFRIRVRILISGKIGLGLWSGNWSGNGMFTVENNSYEKSATDLEAMLAGHLRYHNLP